MKYKHYGLELALFYSMRKMILGRANFNKRGIMLTIIVQEYAALSNIKAEVLAVSVKRFSKLFPV